MQPSTNPVVLEVTNCSKSYPGVQALSDVSLTVRAGEVRGLVGQNGAGKSTLIKVVAGAVKPDSGRVMVEGTELPSTITSHREAGIAVIYQDPGVIPALSARENVFLGDLPVRGGLVDTATMNAQFLSLCSELGVGIDPTAAARSLSLGDRQLIEVMRALRRASTVLILDEPTSALPEHERSRLFAVIARLKTTGIGIVFISHDLEEVLEICETVTVLRDGQHVRTGFAKEFSHDDLVTCMVGYKVENLIRSHSITHKEELRIEGLRSYHGSTGISLHVQAGEILGLAGLLGSGRSAILRAISGADSVQGGRMWVSGQEVSWPKEVREAKRLGINMVSEDRRSLGLVAGEDTIMNVALGQFDKRRWLSRYSAKAEGRAQQGVLKQVKFPLGRETHPVRNLSGGNQQKVLLARLMSLNPRVILLDEPTAGIDVEASAQILGLIQALSNKGAAVIVVMSNLQELLSITDRVHVVRNGGIVAELLSTETTEADLLHQAFAQLSGSES